VPLFLDCNHPPVFCGVWRDQLYVQLNVAIPLVVVVVDIVVLDVVAVQVVVRRGRRTTLARLRCSFYRRESTMMMMMMMMRYKGRPQSEHHHLSSTFYCFRGNDALSVDFFEKKTTPTPTPTRRIVVLFA
jgi:hypothetical protein